MHEFAITRGILSIALEKAKETKASRITEVDIVIGELAGVVDECVWFYFDFFSKDTIAAEAILSFERIPFQLRCRNCGEQAMEVIAGRECYVNSMEVE